MDSFPIAEAQLVALFMQSISYGIHVVTFAICIWTLLNPSTRGRPSVNWPWLSVAVFLFAIGTADLIFNLYHNLIAFIYHGDGSDDAQEVFSDLSSWINVIRSVWFFLGGLLSDAALMYRCWVVGGRRWLMVVLPLLLWFSAISGSAVQLYYDSTLEAMTTIPNEKKLHPFLIFYFTTTLVNNMFCTGSIVYCIWKVSKLSSEFFSQSSRSSGQMKLSGINRIFVESALLYTVSVLMTFVAALAGSNSNYGLSDVSLEIAGISFDLIIIRISRGITTEQTEAFSETFHCAPIAVHITRESAMADAREMDKSSAEAGGHSQPDREVIELVKVYDLSQNGQERTS